MIIKTSCPGRIDIGNTVDYPNYFFSFPNGAAKTVDISVELRTEIIFDSSVENGIEVIFNDVIETNIANNDLNNSKLPFVWALINFFGINQGRFHISSKIPKSSGLGGSAVLLVALVTCVLKLNRIKVEEDIYDRILEFCHLFENWLGYSLTGFHDQLSAIYGSANLWSWGAHFDKKNFLYQKLSLLNNDDYDYYNKRIILAYTGESHEPTKFGSTTHIIDEKKRQTWMEISLLTERFSEALKIRDLNSAKDLLNMECDLRTQMEPSRITQKTKNLIEIAKANGVGSRYAGHGHGGCVWAIGSKEKIENTYSNWESYLSELHNAWVIFPKIAEKGIIIDEH